jgi:hypothetical protein
LSFSGKETFSCCNWWPCPGWRIRACNGICLSSV